MNQILNVGQGSELTPKTMRRKKSHQLQHQISPSLRRRRHQRLLQIHLRQGILAPQPPPDNIV